MSLPRRNTSLVAVAVVVMLALHLVRRVLVLVEVEEEVVRTEQHAGRVRQNSS